MNLTTNRGMRIARWAGLAVALGALVTMGAAAAAPRAVAPLVCNKGPEGQRFNVLITLPARAEAGALYTLRLDGTSSGKISHFGLNHLHDMTVEYLLPPGAAYVEGSAKLVDGTGTANVQPGARLSISDGVVTMKLPGKVENDTDYTPPSITLQLRASGAPGSSAVVSFRHFQLKANAFLVGDVAVTCDPTPKPFPIGATLITPAAASPPVR
jgi:hypothetical protein